MTQMYDPHEEWDREEREARRNTVLERIDQALAGFNKPLQNMTDRAHERSRRDSEDNSES